MSDCPMCGRNCGDTCYQPIKPVEPVPALTPKTIGLMRGFVELCSRAPIELGAPDTMSEARTMFAAMAKQTKSARVIMAMIESDEAVKQ